MGTASSIALFGHPNYCLSRCLNHCPRKTDCPNHSRVYNGVRYCSKNQTFRELENLPVPIGQLIESRGIVKLERNDLLVSTADETWKVRLQTSNQMKQGYRDSQRRYLSAVETREYDFPPGIDLTCCEQTEALSEDWFSPSWSMDGTYQLKWKTSS